MLLRHLERSTYSSLLAPRYPPNPIDIAPAISSASPPYITTCVLPNADSPAVSANGTVNPSESPIVASEIILASILKALFCAPFSNLPSCSSRSKVLSSEYDSSGSEEGSWLERPFSCPSNGCLDTVLQSTGLLYCEDLDSRLDFRFEIVDCWKKIFFRPTSDRTFTKDMVGGKCLTDDLFLRRLGRDVFLKGLEVDADVEAEEGRSLKLASVGEGEDGFRTERVLGLMVGSRFCSRSCFARLFGGSSATMLMSYMF
ncbi:hypothetical protein ACMFMF_011949 [Clarireedia jacksonii]